MQSMHRDEVRDYTFADRALAFRTHADLTQRELTTLLRVSERTIQAWESGLAYPTTAHLQRLIALYLERELFASGHEESEAAALWDMVRMRAERRVPPFDRSWFTSLPRPAGEDTGVQASPDDRVLPAPPAIVGPRREDWGDVPAVPVLWGRAAELAMLARWVGDERCRVVTVLGRGGIGKTALTAVLAHAVAPRFEAVYWRGLRNAPPAEEWLAGAIAALSPVPALPPAGLAARLDLLVDLLRERRALLVLDNLESVLEPGVAAARYRAGYDGYDTALRRLSEGAHRGSVVVTSRERPLRGDGGGEGPVRVLRLEGLGVDEGRALLERHGQQLQGGAAAWGALVAGYAGNPLALGVVGETIAAVFGGDIAAFLAQDTAVFGDIRQLLDDHVARLSMLERALLTALAVEREPVGFVELVAALGPGVARREAVEAGEALQRRALLERAARGEGLFTLQPVVLEYVTACLVERVAGEILAGEPALLVGQALIQASKDGARRSQERMIARPLLERLGTRGGVGMVEQRLLALLEAWRGRPWAEQGHGPGNVINLLRLLRGELRGLDLSGLAIRHAYLQGTEAQDASLKGAHLAPPPTNLPAARTSFVGRTADMAGLTRALNPTAAGGTRVLTLTGVAGCGKTRLALAVVAAVRAAYRDGVWLVELAPLPASPAADPTPVATATLRALGLQEQPGQAPLETLTVHLRTRRLLLLLDNCEHVVAACDALAARLLTACLGLRILATSQQPLGLQDETIWPVAALAATPPMAGVPTAEAIAVLERAEAVQLFVERARAVRPGFALSAATAASVAAICRQLDGLPLAIELAAARLNVLPVEEVLARLDGRFRLLRRVGGATGDRHRALQAAMDWSYGLLAPSGQALLRRLAVFADGWEVGAAEAVCAGRPDRSNPGATGDQGAEVAREAVLALLDELLDRSLVYVYEAGGVPRYGMLETVRLYALQQLEQAGEAAELRDRHLTWCATLAERAAPALLGPEQASWMARLDREHDNLRAAMQWALDRGLQTLGLQVAGGLRRFWRSRGHRREGRHWLALLLALAGDDDSSMGMAVQANALDGAAALAEDEHDFAEASASFARSGALRRALGQGKRSSGLLLNAALEARARGDYLHATTLLERSLAQHRVLGHQEGITQGGLADLLTHLALVLREQGAYARATTLYEESLALHREFGYGEGIAQALLGLGDVARDQGEAAWVRTRCKESLALFRDLGVTWGIGFSLNNLALAAYLDGDLTQAARLAEESMAVFRGMQARPSLAEVLITVGRIEGARGKAAAARSALAETLQLAWAEGPRLFVAAALEELGVLSVQQGHARHGVNLLAAGATLRQAMGAPVRPADRRALDDALATAPTVLGSAAFAAAWATGQTLPAEQILACASAAQDERTATPAQDACAS